MDSELDFWYFQLNFCAIHVSDSYYAAFEIWRTKIQMFIAAKIVQIADNSYADNCIRLESHKLEIFVGISLKAPFSWKFWKLAYIVSTCQGHKKNVSILEVRESAPAPPKPPVFRVALLHTDVDGKWPFEGSVFRKFVAKHIPV